MPKTNHKRGYRDSTNYTPKYIAWYGFSKLQLSDKIIGAIATNGDSTCGKHGAAQNVRGAKKFVHSRSRFHENLALKKLIKDSEVIDLC